MRIPNIVPSWLVGIFTGKAVVPAVTVTYCPPRAAEGAYISWASVGRGTDPIKYLG
jgi:hypothetical protein